jgi:hypothetical protein
MLNMRNNNQRFATAFGLCVTIASLCSGCAATDVNRVPMSAHDLNYFKIDCSKKEQQIAMLQSMRQSSDEQFGSQVANMAQFWTAFTDPAGYQRRLDVGSGNVNKQINYNLQHLRYCP